jgi:GT2 family glycosyltransferase
MNERGGVVVIGRNEGARLRICLGSVLLQSRRVVYVDSDSTDDSVAYAKSLSVDVVQLDMRIPFSAARARNDGFQFLCQKYPEIIFVQFIDGDCELLEGWLDRALSFLDSSPSYAIAAGRVIERFPEKSIYNRLCGIEWNTPVGDAKACGGIFLIRRSAFESVGGFNPVVVAGEEPDLCYRLGGKDWKIRRIDNDMALHDSAIYRFSQWWRRAKRAGHGYAQGFALHFRDGNGYYLKESMRCWIWALGVPLLTILFAFVIRVYALAVLVLYPARFIKTSFNKYKQCRRSGDSVVYGLFTVLASWPQFIGQLLYIKRLLTRANITVIEHK